MLSEHALQFFDDFCVKSHVAYPGGGVVWTYVEGANQAHSKFVNPHRKSEAVTLDFNQLRSWLQTALGGRIPMTYESSGMVKELIDFLQADLGIDSFLWGFEDNGYDMMANIYMRCASDNRYFALELWCSVD